MFTHVTVYISSRRNDRVDLKQPGSTLIGGAFAFALLSFALLASQASAAPIWSGTASDNWSVGGPGGNWSGAASPGTSGQPQFQNVQAEPSAGVTSNIVDANFTVSQLSYENTTGNYHTTEIAGGRTLTITNTLRSGVAISNTDAAGVSIIGTGLLNLGSASPATLTVGLNSGATFGRSKVVISAPVQTVNLNTVNVGTVSGASSLADGQLEFTSSSITGLNFIVNQNVNIGTGRGGLGTLTFQPGLSSLSVGQHLYIGAQTGGGTGGSPDTVGQLNLPTSATLIVGAGGSGNLFVGEKIGTSAGAAIGTLNFGGTLAGNIDTLRVGINFDAQGSAQGIVDLSSAALPGGLFSVQNLEVGVGNVASGTLTFGPSLTDLFVGQSLRLGAGSTQATGNVFGNASTIGTLNLPDNVNITVAGNSIGDLRVGERTTGTGGGANHQGTLAPVGGTFTANQLQNLFVGVNRFSLGIANGTVDLSNMTIAGGELNLLGDLDVGVGSRATGVLSFNSTLQDLTIGGSLRLGIDARNGSGTSGTINLPDGINLKIGAVTPGEILMAHRASFNSTAGGGFAFGSLSYAGGTLEANLTQVRIGTNDAPTLTANIDGIFDAGSAQLVGAGFAVSGDIVIGTGRQTNGTLRLGSGQASAVNLTLGDNVAGTNAGLGFLDLNGTHFTLSGTASIRLNGSIDVEVGNRSAGLYLTDSSASVLSIAAGSDGYDIVFSADPLNANYAANAAVADGIFYALRWEGNHVSTLQSLASSGLISWDDMTYLSGQFNGMASIFYDAGTNSTYIGFYTIVPEPGSAVLLLTGIVVLRRRARCRCRSVK